MIAVMVTVTLLLVVLYFITYSQKLGKLDLFSEQLRNISSDAISSTQGYTSYLSYLFIFILGCNMLGMIPYTLTITSFALTTFCLSLMSFIGLNVVALAIHGVKLADLFLPSGAPLIMS